MLWFPLVAAVPILAVVAAFLYPDHEERAAEVERSEDAVGGSHGMEAAGRRAPERSPRALSWPSRRGPDEEKRVVRQLSWHASRQAEEGGATARDRQDSGAMGASGRDAVRPGYLHGLLRSRHRSHGNVSEGIVSEDGVTQLGREGVEGASGPGSSEHRDAEIHAPGRGGRDEGAMALLPPRPPPAETAAWTHDHQGNHPQAPFDQQHFASVITRQRIVGTPGMDQRDTMIGIRGELDNIDTHSRGGLGAGDMKGELKVCYTVTGIAGAGIISIYSGYLGNQNVQIHGHYLKTCTFFLIASFMSGVSLILVSYPRPCIYVPVEIIKTLKYTTLGYLTLAVIDICTMFLEIYVLLAVVAAFIPTLVMLMYLFITARYQHRLQLAHARVNSRIRVPRAIV